MKILVIALICAGLLPEITAAIQFTMPTSSFVGVQTGSQINITWSNAIGAVEIYLSPITNSGSNIGSPGDVKITTNQTGSSFLWVVPSSIQTEVCYLWIGDTEGYGARTQAFTLINITNSTSTSATSLTATITTTITSSSSTVTISTTRSTSIPLTHQGLSTGGKAGIGVGVTLGGLAFISFIWTVFRHVRRFVAKDSEPTPEEGAMQKVELEEGISRPIEIGELSNEEGNGRLERLRIAEIEGRGIAPGAGASGSAELEAPRLGDVFELS